MAKYKKPSFSNKYKFNTKQHGEIELDVTDKGFTLWTTERGSRGRNVRHWIFDASCINEDGEIRIGRECHWKKVIKYLNHTIEGESLKLIKRRSIKP